MKRALAALTCLTLLTGCSRQAQRLSDSDTRFVAQMIPHHELGMRLIDDATLHSYDVRLRRMVFEMSGYHETEMHRLHTLAEAHRITSSANFPGSISQGSIHRLSDLTGLDHDTWWLYIMIAHHEGAMEIAKSALSTSTNGEVSAIAESVQKVQFQEIAEMRQLLGELCTTNASLAGC